MYFFFMPDFMTKYTAHEVEKAKASGASEAAIKAKVEGLEKAAQAYNKPAGQRSGDVLWSRFPVGVGYHADFGGGAAEKGCGWIGAGSGDGVKLRL